MTFQDIFLLMVVAAFSGLLSVLFVVTLWSNRPARRSREKPVATQAVRPADTGLDSAA